MSHLVKKECAMRDLQTLLDAALSLGWEVRAEERVKYFAGAGEVCQHVLHFSDDMLDDYGNRLNRKYNIGIQIEGDKLSLLHDNAMNGRDVMYGDQVDSCTERVVNRLKQAYQVCAARKVAQRKGWRLSEQKLEDGRVVLKMKVR